MPTRHKVKYIVSLIQLIEIEVHDEDSPSTVEFNARAQAVANILARSKNVANKFEPTIGDMMDLRFIEKSER